MSLDLFSLKKKDLLLFCLEKNMFYIDQLEKTDKHTEDIIKSQIEGPWGSPCVTFWNSISTAY